MGRSVISGTGLYTPPHRISNDELVASFNEYVRRFNAAHGDEIAAGGMSPLMESSSEFIEKASGIRNRFVMDKAGILDPDVMCPRLPQRTDDEASLQCEMGVAAAREALAAARKEAADIDAVLVACSNLQRPYPAVAIEIQHALGIRGFAVDMNMACSSATFGIQAAADAISSGNARAVLIVNPEICTAHLNFRDRDSHFIFGDACTALIVEEAARCTAAMPFEVVGTRLRTSFSNNIRNNFGFLNRCAPERAGGPDKLFVQQGRKVFKEVIPMVAGLIQEHLSDLKIAVHDVKRLWLHQANLNMNLLIGSRVLGREALPHEAPLILDEYGNTSSAGSIIAFHKHRGDLAAGNVGVICSFGAGYSAGSVIVRRAA
ncbi:MAG TPA: beta-ketoacyl-ACP synthase III [Desulfuromonadaceae bacterium]